MTIHDVAVLGASGYAGAELLRYLHVHPHMEVVWASADTHAGRRLGELYGHLPAFADLELQPSDAGAVPSVALTFIALPHLPAAAAGATLVDRGVAVVDISAAWRLDKASVFETWYGAHPSPARLGSWAYGLPELSRAAVAKADRVANPGCYPTAVLLALAPLLREGVVQADGIVIDAVSGVSGAGRKVEADYLYTELEASCTAYGVTSHRHTPEIEQELGKAAGTELRVTFTPHLVPMTRGLLATCYARLRSADDPREVLRQTYAGEPFVHVVAPGAQPATKQVAGTNNAMIAVETDSRTHTVVVTCAIDNLGKGAAGQAVQNANLVLGVPEASGLGAQGVFP